MTASRPFKILTRSALAAGALVCCVPLVLPALPASAATQPASRQLEQAAAALRGISTLRADFTQTDRAGQVLGGKLTLKNPGKIRFAYDDVNMLVVSNGSSLAFADYEVQQLRRYPIGDSPLGALLDPKRDITRYGKLMQTADPEVVSIAVSDPKRPEFPQITLIFVRNGRAPGGLELVSWVALDAQNQRTTVRLSNHRYGVPVADSEFRYRDPRGSSRRPG